MSGRWFFASGVASLFFLSLHAQHSQAHRAVRAAPKAQPSSLQLDEVVIDTSVQPQIGTNDTGSAVVRAQILLGRSHFSCGVIDGRFGHNLQTTIRAFQGDRNLPVSGVIDDATWKALNADTTVPIAAITISPQDVQGPFYKIPAGIMQQAKLPAMSYQSPLEEFAERYHTSQEVIRVLNPHADFALPGQELKVPNVAVARPADAARVVVSKDEGAVRALDAGGKLLSFYVATTGSEHDPLPLGDWKILGVAWNPKFHYSPNLFWDAKKTDDKATIQPGPNNPVGVVWIQLSKEHYGIHGTPHPGQVGHAYSHGCIRLTNWDAIELAEMVKPGTPATLRD